MANQFVMYGKISAIKDSEKFHPIERKKFDSGWTNTSVKFNCISGTNRIMCATQGGKWLDDSRNVIKAPSATPGSNSKREIVAIPWDKRFDNDQIDKVAGFRHCVVDLGDRNKRYKLQSLIDAFKNNKDTAELIAETGCNTLEEAKTEYEKSIKKRHVFINEWDFAEYMTKVVASDKIKGKIFKITGIQDLQYSPSKEICYATYKVNRVELAPEGTEESAKMNVDFYFANDCVDERDGIGYINGWTSYYDGNLKKIGFDPVCIVMRGDEKQINGLKKKLACEEDEIKNIGISVDIIDGAPISAITYDDLSDEDKEDVDFGFITVEEIAAAMNVGKVGERITELRFSGWNGKKRKAEATSYNIENMIHAIASISDNENESVVDEDDDI